MRALCDAIGDVEIAGYTAQNANESLKQQIDRTIKEATRFITIGEAFEDWAGIISSDTEALRKHFIKLIKITKKGFFKYRMSQDQFRNKNSVAGQ